MNREKYPELAKRFDALVKQRDAVLKRVKPLEDEADRLHVEVDKATKKWRAVRERAAAIEEKGNLRGISQELAALARAMGARSLQAEGA